MVEGEDEVETGPLRRSVLFLSEEEEYFRTGDDKQNGIRRDGQRQEVLTK